MSRALAAFIPGIGVAVPSGTPGEGEQERGVGGEMCVCCCLHVPFPFLSKLLFFPGHCPSDPPVS